MKSSLRCAVVLLACLAVRFSAQALVINVPLDQPTIQAGIDAASPGDTVLVADGTYYENINFLGKAITVTSVNGPASTTIDGSSTGNVVTFQSHEGRDSLLEGFTITNGASGTETGTVDWWPMYRHDTSGSAASSSTVPDEVHLIWYRGLTGGQTSQPLSVMDGRVYVTSRDALWCLDAATGQEIWSYDNIYTDGRIDSAPTITDTRVYVGLKNFWSYGAMVCLDAETGEEVWVENAYGTGGTFDVSSWSSTAYVSGDRIYYYSYWLDSGGVGSRGHTLICRNRFTGQRLWYRSYYDEVYPGGIALAPGNELFVSEDDSMRKYEATGPTLIWQIPGLFIYPVWYGNKVYTVTHDRVYCHDAMSGKEVWVHECVYPYQDPGRVAASDGKIYFRTSGGYFNCLDATTGDELWSVHEPSSTFFQASIGDDRVVVPDLANNLLYCFNGSDGSEVWTYPFSGDASGQAAALADGKIYLTGQAYGVLCLGSDPPQVPTLSAALLCSPAAGTLPLDLSMDLVVTNERPDQTRTAALRLDVTLGNGAFYSNWRNGHTVLEPAEFLWRSWAVHIPDFPSLAGINTFHLQAQDTTPPPYNQPPYLPSGFTSSDTCTMSAARP